MPKVKKYDPRADYRIDIKSDAMKAIATAKKRLRVAIPNHEGNNILASPRRGEE